MAGAVSWATWVRQAMCLHKSLQGRYTIMQQ